MSVQAIWTTRQAVETPAPQVVAPTNVVVPVPLPVGRAKRTLDVAASLALIVLLSPLLLLLALLVRLSGPGPVVFSQVRVGRGGRPITVRKFRSMVADAEELQADVIELNEHRDGPLFKMRADPRVTPLGRWMRKLSLDELPQLFNVLEGSMSLVGPRPALPDEVAQYPPELMRRLCVNPGLTGLWQVSGRSDLSWDESVALDLSYVDQCSIWLDLQILIRTIPAVVLARGAY